MSVNKFIGKLLGISTHTASDPGLQQGVTFNGLQQKIINRTLPALPLMEQTSMPGIGSIVENLANQENTISSLQRVDNKEFEALKALEIEFNRKLSAYVAAYKAHLNTLASRSPCTTTNVMVGSSGSNTRQIGLKDVYSCSTTPVNAQDAGWNDRFAIEIGDNEFMVRRTDQSTGWGQDLELSCQYGGCGAASGAASGSGAAKLKLLNDELLDISNRMWTHTQKLHSTDTELQAEIDAKRSLLRQRVQSLQGQRDNHNQLAGSQITLQGELEDNRAQLNAAYYHYLVWFIAASTLGIVAFHQLAKK